MELVRGRMAKTKEANIDEADNPEVEPYYRSDGALEGGEDRREVRDRHALIPNKRGRNHCKMLSRFPRSCIERCTRQTAVMAGCSKPGVQTQNLVRHE